MGGIRTSEGSGAAAWDTRYGQGAVARDKNGNVYAGKDGTVYKKDNSGNWSSNSGNGWENVNKPQPGTPRATTTSTSRAQPSATRTQPSATTPARQPSNTSWGSTSRDSVQSLNSQAQSRSWGNRQASQYSTGSRTSSGWSGRSGGGGRSGGRR